jgi:L,D-transpeptidase ErfK/SrfK
VGTKVTVVNQPFVFGWRGGALFVQAFPIAEDDEREHPAGADALLNAAISDEMWRTVREHDVAVDLALVNVIAADSRGVAVPVSHPVQRAEVPPKPRRKNQPPPPAAPVFSMDRYLAAARHVENKLPEGSNWNGKDELLVSSEEFEATRNGIILPNESQPKKAVKPANKAKATRTPAAKAQPKRAAPVVADEKLEVETPASAKTSAASIGKGTRGAGAP